MRAYPHFDPGSIWKLPSGSYVEVLHVARGGQTTCFFVDVEGRKLRPLARNELTLAADFLELYAELVRSH